MPSAIELSIQFGLPVRKIKEICDYFDISLDENAMDNDKEFQHIARSVKRKRTSAYTLAWLYTYATDEQREFVFGMDEDIESAYTLLGLPIGESEKLAHASAILKKLSDVECHDKAAWSILAVWIKERISEAGDEVNHAYLAVRLLLSLPKEVMRDYPSIIATVLNRARHRKYLDGWHTTVADESGKNIVIYHKLEALVKPIVQLDLSQEDIDKFAARLGTNDISALTSFIAYERKLDIKKVKAFLTQKQFDL